MAMDIAVIWGSGEANYFCKRDWTTQISLIRLMNFISARRASWRGKQGVTSRIIPDIGQRRQGSVC
jgi:hypothetical protein